MKRILVGVVVGLAALAVGVSLAFAQAAPMCTDSNGNPITCPSNGPTTPEPTGWLVVADGVDGCPTWFPNGCALPPSVQASLGL